MKISKELLEKAKTAKTAEELLAMAKAEKIELTEEEAAKVFAELHKMGELSDEEVQPITKCIFMTVFCWLNCDFNCKANEFVALLLRFSFYNLSEVNK